MAYLKIKNLYTVPHILECFALEKIEGSSANISFKKDAQVTFFPGCANHNQFAQLFPANIYDTFKEVFAEYINEQGEYPEVTFFGEVHGGKIQGMSKWYGPDIKFIVFDVKINGRWMNVPYAEEKTVKMGLKFVPYERGPLTIEFLDAQRDAPSKISLSEDAPKEGIVVRAIYESNSEDGYRFIYKHKRAEFRETKTVREVSAEDAKIWSDAKEAAEEYTTPIRLNHVLQKLGDVGVKDTGKVVRAMIDDIFAEAREEISWSKALEKEIGKITVKLFHGLLESNNG